MSKQTKLTAVLAAIFMAVALAVIAPTIDAIDAETQAKKEQERIEKENAEAEAAWQKAYGNMTTEERLQGVVYE